MAAQTEGLELPLAAEFAARLSDSETVGAKVAHAMAAIGSLGVLKELEGGPRSLASLAGACEVEADSLYRLLRFLGPIEVVAEVEPGLYGLAPLGRFASGAPQPVIDGVEWYWTAWAAIAEGLRARRHAVRGGKRVRAVRLPPGRCRSGKVLHDHAGAPATYAKRGCPRDL